MGEHKEAEDTTEDLAKERNPGYLRRVRKWIGRSWGSVRSYVPAAECASVALALQSAVNGIAAMTKGTDTAYRNAEEVYAQATGFIDNRDTSRWLHADTGGIRNLIRRLGGSPSRSRK